MVRCVPVREAEKPRDGEALVGRWWVYQPDGGIVFLGDRPQCHTRQAVVKVMARRFPECEPRYIPLVYVGQP